MGADTPHNSHKRKNRVRKEMETRINTTFNSVLLLAFVLCAVVSCQKPTPISELPDQETEEVTDSDLMYFAYSPSQSKTATRSNPLAEDEDAQMFNSGDVIAISVNSVGLTTQGFRDYYYNGTDWEPVADANVDANWWSWEGRPNADFRSYYPVNESTSFTTFATPRKQDTEALIAAADYMRQETVTKYYIFDEKVQLTMERNTARVVIEIVNSYTYYATRNPTNAIKFHEIAFMTISAPKSYSGSSASSDTVRVQPFKLYPTATENGKMFALIPPSVVNSSEVFLQFRYNAEVVSKPRTVDLEAGKSYTFRLTLLPSGEFVWEGEVKIENWTENVYNNQVLD